MTVTRKPIPLFGLGEIEGLRLPHTEGSASLHRSLPHDDTDVCSDLSPRWCSVKVPPIFR